MNASITYPYDERILQLFEPEEKRFPRASYTITSDEKQITFSVEAADATALRAALTTITKVLSVWETTLMNGAARAQHG